MAQEYGDTEAAKALTDILPNSEWEGLQLARAFSKISEGASDEDAAEAVFRVGPLSRPKCLTLIGMIRQNGFLATLTPRSDTGSSINPITKLFPATVTEQRFIVELDQLLQSRASLSYDDDRESGHTLSDFTLSDFTVRENDLELQINIKNAGTRFENAENLVGIDPNDCIPIPAYKAYAAIEKMPNLLYAVAVDYTLTETLHRILPDLFTEEERIVWDVLSRFKGSKIRKAEDAFIWTSVNRHWDAIQGAIASVPFHVISARKSVTILKNNPRRTPGIGMRAWGNRASAEVNVHLSVSEDTKPWQEVADRILASGVKGIVEAVNRRRQEWVYDPEI